MVGASWSPGASQRKLHFRRSCSVSTYIRTGINTCVSGIGHLVRRIRRRRTRQVLSADMARNNTHVVNIDLTNIRTHVKQHSARTSEQTTMNTV